MHWQIGQSGYVMRAVTTCSVQSPVPVRFQPSGIGLIESHHGNGFFMDWRRDRFPKILFIIGGAGILLHGGSRIAFRAYSVCVVPAGLRHRLEDERGRPVSLYGLGLRAPRFADGNLMAAIFREPVVHMHVPPQIPSLFKELLAEERLEAPHAATLQISIVQRILVELARRPSPSPAQRDSRQSVRLCARAMEHGFWDEQDIDTAARKASLSRRRFTQLFREVEGVSWHSRLTRLRLAHAARLLRATGLSIRAVAFESGYADLSHFYRAFRAEHGVSPAAFRHRGGSGRRRAH